MKCVPRGLILAAHIGFVAMVALGAFAEGGPRRDRRDQNDLAVMLHRHPEAVDLLEKGEALLRAGHAKDALGPLRAAVDAAPESPLAARRLCEALLAQGQRGDAERECQRALANGGSPADMRAMVAVWMSGEKSPTAQEMAQAMALARAATNAAPSEPWGYAAECDIATRLGDRSMLNDCLESLRRVAPSDEETARATAAARPAQPSWVPAFGWSAIVFAFVATGVHAFLRSRRGARHRLSTGVAALLLVLGATPSSRSALADVVRPANSAESPTEALSKWPIDDGNPEGSIPPPDKRDADPLQFGYFLMDLSDRANLAIKRGDHQAAAKYFRAAVAAVPDRSLLWAGLCTEYEALGDRPKAIAACAKAIGTRGARVSDFEHYASLVLARTGTLSPPEAAAVSAVVEALGKTPHGVLPANRIQCQLSARTGDVQKLGQCVAALTAAEPDAPSTLSFQWALAVKVHDYLGAERLVERARSVGVATETVERMERLTWAEEPLWRRLVVDRRARAWALVFVLAAVGAWCSWLVRRRRTGPLAAGAEPG